MTISKIFNSSPSHGGKSTDLTLGTVGDHVGSSTTTFSGSEVEAIMSQRAIVGDLLAILQKPSLEGVVAAVVDHVNVSSPLTHATKPTTPGATLIGTALEGYAPSQTKTLKAVIDGALKFGVIDESHLSSLSRDPSPLVVPLKKLISNLNKPSTSSSPEESVHYGVDTPQTELEHQVPNNGAFNLDNETLAGEAEQTSAESSSTTNVVPPVHTNNTTKE